MPPTIFDDADDTVTTPAARLARLEAVLGLDTPWPLRDVLARLADAVDHLLIVHHCDRHGYEETADAVRAARAVVARLDEEEER